MAPPASLLAPRLDRAEMWLAAADLEMAIQPRWPAVPR